MEQKLIFGEFQTQCYYYSQWTYENAKVITRLFAHKNEQSKTFFQREKVEKKALGQ